MKFFKVRIQGKKSFYLIFKYLCLEKNCNGIRSFFRKQNYAFQCYSFKKFSKVFRENVNVLSSSSGKDNFYVFLLFLAETNWQIIVITFSISFLEDLTFLEIHIFSFLTPCCATHRVKKEALISII